MDKTNEWLKRVVESLVVAYGSQREVCKMIGVHENYLSMLVRGTRSPVPPKFMNKIDHVFHIKYPNLQPSESKKEYGYNEEQMLVTLKGKRIARVVLPSDFDKEDLKRISEWVDFQKKCL